MPLEGLYRRPLPAGFLPFSSPQGRALFREALDAGTMEGYFPLAEQFHTQADPAFCGLGTLVIVLNALGIDPGRLWRGPWRWYSEELLDCCRPLEVVRREGMTLDDLACLARCNGATATLARPPAADLEELREAIRAAARSAEGLHVVAAYDRQVLGQTGAGHYSPLAGYHAGHDAALLLDVARFKYPPHWVPLPILYEAMRPEDRATGRPRGWVMLARAEAGLALGSIARRDGALFSLMGPLRTALQQGAPTSAIEVVTLLLRELPGDAADLLTLYTDGLGALAPEHRALLRDLMEGLRHSALHPLVEQALAVPAREGPAVQRFLAARSAPVERATLLLAVLPEALLSGLPQALQADLAVLRSAAAMPPSLRGEVERLRGQFEELTRACCLPGP